jgi:hypothetical protein
MDRFAASRGKSRGVDSMSGLKGQALAEAALRVYRLREETYRAGITVDELEREMRLQGIAIASDNNITALRSALNASQAKGTWRLVDAGMWLPGDSIPKGSAGLSGRALADALYGFVRVRYPGHEFHYEEARVALEKTGVEVKGTGNTTRGALTGSPDRFTPVAGKRGYWRWK